MDGNTLIGLPWDWKERNRSSIKVWFRGKVTTIGKMEDVLVDEYLDQILPFKDGSSEENKRYNLKLCSDRFRYVLDPVWRHEYLRSLNPDECYRDKQVGK